VFFTTVQLPVLNRSDLEKFHGIPQGSQFNRPRDGFRPQPVDQQFAEPLVELSAKLLRQQLPA